ncbi:uncharacterized protein [Rutidosis leptorrhynchoides]|uniref:uncharacterized protein n=1 Tax=Rutidosis leptorrhynchoides TaxID=125765 RepID=UPI003A9A52B0
MVRAIPENGEAEDEIIWIADSSGGVVAAFIPILLAGLIQSSSSLTIHEIKQERSSETVLMEKEATNSIDGSKELQCVGRLEIVRPKPVVFLCGSIPVHTDKSFQDFNSALVPSSEKVTAAPRYRMLPAETDLNTPPLSPTKPVHSSKASGEIPWDDDAISSDLTRKCEALAVTGLVEYGDEIDVIAPADILKQIFKMPYSKARLSIAVHRIGQTLVLNTGPDVEEGEKLVRRHKSQSTHEGRSLFSNFAKHSVRMEACDCPPTHPASSKGKSSSSALPGKNPPKFVGQSDDVTQNEGFGCCSEYPNVKQEGFYLGSKKNKKNKSRDPVKKASDVGEMPRCSVQESEKRKRASNDGFLRVSFWQFHNFRMLLGSDLLLFSNDKYVAVSLHLWDVARQVTPLTWLEAWLDNVMASVPELAICYHHNGVVQGYELLKTNDIFMKKGISEDGTPAFHPHVVQQNGLSVLRFLQENCKQDPGAYWLHKEAGEEVIQIFDLSVIPKNNSDDDDDGSTSVPSLLHRWRSDSLLSLGTLLYRMAHKLSLSLAPNNKAKCAKYFKKCLELLDGRDHLVLRAIAHEQFARLILTDDEELDLAAEFVLLECGATVMEAKEECLDPLISFPETVHHGNVCSIVVDDEDGKDFSFTLSETPVKMTGEGNATASQEMIASGDTISESEDPICDSDESVSTASAIPTAMIEAVPDTICSKLAAIHHVSQAIKSLRWMRQLRASESESVDHYGDIPDGETASINFSVCACGDAECIEVCDIREWLPTSKLDHKLWKLVLLLGESYLALGEAYKKDSQLHEALKVVELASTVYGSMPQHMEDTRFISSMNKCSTSPTGKTESYIREVKEVNSSSSCDFLTFEQFSSTYLFWPRAWTLVGDVYVELCILKTKEVSTPSKRKYSAKELLSPVVEKEVKRLKKKLGEDNQNCSSCSLVNCSCQSDRASSGSSASSSTGNARSVSFGRKHSKRPHIKSTPHSIIEDHDRKSQHMPNGNFVREAPHAAENPTLTKSLAANPGKIENVPEMHNKESDAAFSETAKTKNGGIFKYLRGDFIEDAEHNLCSALNCYVEAINALSGFPTGSEELLSIMKKKGWVCNELGRMRLERKELSKAEHAFADAINAFREVSDHTNIVLINMNLGHGRRAKAEEMVSKIESLKVHEMFQHTYKRALDTAKSEYCEALRHYGAAKSEVYALTNDGLRNEVLTQFAHTYLRLGMFLAREDITAEVYNNVIMQDMAARPTDRRVRKELRKHEISANDAIREALTVYESLGEIRKQETAFAYYQLASYQRKCCLNFLESGQKKTKLPKGESSMILKAKQYASLAEWNWKRAIDFYGPEMRPVMYLTILMERSHLSFNLWDSLHSNAMVESALCHLLEGRHIPKANFDSLKHEYPELHSRFWNQLQLLLKNMLAAALKPTSGKAALSVDPLKLRELYKMSLKTTDLDDMYSLWTS